jgi:hypothetical protein
MTPYRWLDRRIAAAGPFLTLCLSEQEFYHALSKIKVADRPAWVNPGAHATTHHMRNSAGDATCIVCLNDWHDRSGIEIAGLLIHEAVHVWQEYCDMIGETTPGREQEAYAVQAIAQELMAEFKRRTVK